MFTMHCIRMPPVSCVRATLFQGTVVVMFTCVPREQPSASAGHFTTSPPTQDSAMMITDHDLFTFHSTMLLIPHFSSSTSNLRFGASPGFITLVGILCLHTHG